ncbi:YwbE family protein [Aspergillus ibericus CBS 121593]|uniref:Uncharacterized protein n=1 Tax=Aspergillus ibericus CBS 121593 TaxID=1448316 RepID=A0A395GIJ2_9EURO|nr:hypothetical protein BO80DRAFT_369198 [Aspergillus ibericus CBS 121593]RAK95271.1 hypothetical protein BO80DRAFT_369198 [Aspergillus ibericus CBS 121593]
MPPTTTEVIPGACVNIVLKKDQPTGRTVTGTVADVLTRGNHPRGIKVRLRDGRVGRVQSLSSNPPSFVGGDGRRVRFAGVEQDGEGGGPEESIGLDAYVTNSAGRQRGRGRGRQGGSSGEGEGQDHADFEYGIVTCPVCGDFQGDEAAVAHHVAGHFD